MVERSSWPPGSHAPICGETSLSHEGSCELGQIDPGMYDAPEVMHQATPNTAKQRPLVGFVGLGLHVYVLVYAHSLYVIIACCMYFRWGAIDDG